jgi:protein SCO1
LKPRGLLALALGAAAVGIAPVAAGAGAFEASAHVDFEQHLDETLPSDLGFRDENGQAVRLAEYLGAAPGILLFTYFGCTNMCPAVIGNLAARLSTSGLAGASLPQVLVVSVNPDDSPGLAALKKREVAARLGEAADRWHLLTGNAAAIERLARTVGFRYAYDDASRQYAHPAGLVLLTPEARISRYFFGFDYTPMQLAEGIQASGARRIASPIERLLLVCFHYDPMSGGHSAAILAALQALCLVSLAGALAWFRWRLLPRSQSASRSA